MDLEIVFLNFTKGEFDAASPHSDLLKEWYEGWKIDRNAGKGCARCRHRRVNAKYKNKIRDLLAADAE